MINMGNHRHVSDVGLFIHDGPYLVYCEVHLEEEKWEEEENIMYIETACGSSKRPNQHHKNVPWSHQHQFCLGSICFTRHSTGRGARALQTAADKQRGLGLWHKQRTPALPPCPMNCSNASGSLRQTPTKTKPHLAAAPQRAGDSPVFR